MMGRAHALTGWCAGLAPAPVIGALSWLLRPPSWLRFGTGKGVENRPVA
jgi:hypothetical protein